MLNKELEEYIENTINEDFVNIYRIHKCLGYLKNNNSKLKESLESRLLEYRNNINKMEYKLKRLNQYEMLLSEFIEVINNPETSYVDPHELESYAEDILSLSYDLGERVNNKTIVERSEELSYKFYDLAKEAYEY